MTARLYQFAGSPYCAKVRKILDFKGIDYEIVEVDYLERKELLAVSDQLMVPALTLDGGETIVDSTRIAVRLEELQPEPTLLPSGWRGMHRMLAGYIDNVLSEVLFRAAIPDKAAYYGSEGKDRGAMWRLIRERHYGAGFVDQMIANHDTEMALAAAALAPFEEALSERPFILGRIGLADFALYGQLCHFTFTGTNRIPPELKGLLAFYGRMDRISSAPEPA
ncbi:MAG: glutathione S-transferase family protein [Candidatus Binataceae bacterium]